MSKRLTSKLQGAAYVLVVVVGFLPMLAVFAVVGPLLLAGAIGRFLMGALERSADAMEAWAKRLVPELSEG